MDVIDVDHYVVLNLPSGEKGAMLSQHDISKAYKKKALELHPDKRPNDPNAHLDFQKLKTSYDILKDEKLRKSYDDLVRRVEQHKSQRRERAAAAAAAPQEEEERRSASRKRKLDTARMHYCYYSREAYRRIARRRFNEEADRVPVKRYSIKVARRKLNKEAAQILSMYKRKKL